jgi:hypothetical protein
VNLGVQSLYVVEDIFGLRRRVPALSLFRLCALSIG